jgi:lysophospholipase L1-like esterase
VKKISVLTYVLMLTLPAVVAAQAPATPAAPLDPNRFEPEIRKFEEADRATAPRKDLVVFVGSSSIRRWDSLAADFPGVAVLNRGFGGSEASDVVRYADRILIPLRPAHVVFYAGDNDLARGKSPAQIAADVRALWQGLNRKLPDTRLTIISVKPSLARWSLVEKTRQTNALLREFAATDPRLSYVDVFTPMIGPDGKPIPSHFVEDGLHMTPEGYRVWTAALTPIFKR